MSPDPAEMTAALLAGEPGTSAHKLPPNPYTLGDLRDPPGGLLDLTAMAEDPYIAPKKPVF
jgi:hypothetical protein